MSHKSRLITGTAWARADEFGRYYKEPLLLLTEPGVRAASNERALSLFGFRRFFYVCCRLGSGRLGSGRLREDVSYVRPKRRTGRCIRIRPMTQVLFVCRHHKLITSNLIIRRGLYAYFGF